MSVFEQAVSADALGLAGAVAAVDGDADGAAACSDELAAYARTVKVVYR